VLGRLCSFHQFKVGDAIVLIGSVGTERPVPVGRLYRSHIENDLQSVAFHVSHVGEHGLVEVHTGGDGYGGKQVPGLAVVVIDASAETIIEESEIKSQIA